MVEILGDILHLYEPGNITEFDIREHVPGVVQIDKLEDHFVIYLESEEDAPEAADILNLWLKEQVDKKRKYIQSRSARIRKVNIYHVWNEKVGRAWCRQIMRGAIEFDELPEDGRVCERCLDRIKAGW